MAEAEKLSDRKLVHDMNGHAAVILANLQALAKYADRMTAVCRGALEQPDTPLVPPDEKKRIEFAVAETADALNDALDATRDLIAMLRQI